MPRKEKNVDNADAVVGIAQMIGIDLINEPQYLYIALEASRAELPDDWVELENEDGETLYFHVKERKTQTEHPLITRYKQMYYNQRRVVKQMESGDMKSGPERPDVKLAAITADVMSRASQGKPPATPDIVEGLAKILSIDSTKEFFLFRVVKETLLAYVEKKFELASFIRDMTHPVQFLRSIRQKQNQVDVIRKPTTIIMCQECGEKSAVVKCEDCKDYFCQTCFNTTHKKGKRRTHITSDVEQLVCACYDDRVATCQCVQCGLFFSDEGFYEVHALAKKPRRITEALEACHQWTGMS